MSPSKNFCLKASGCWNKTFKCPNAMNDVYENIDNCNPNRKRKKLIVFDDMIAEIMTKNFKPQLKKYLLGAEN